MSSNSTHPRWYRIHSPWELLVIDQGSAPVGTGLNMCKYKHALGKMCGQAVSQHQVQSRSLALRSCWSVLPADTSASVPHATCLELFWEQWDWLPTERKTSLDKKRLGAADLKKLDDSYIRTNLIIIDAPCPRLSRVARLAKVSATQSLLKPTCASYAVLGRFPTYVGQIGGKARK